MAQPAMNATVIAVSPPPPDNTSDTFSVAQPQRRKKKGGSIDVDQQLSTDPSGDAVELLSKELMPIVSEHLESVLHDLPRDPIRRLALHLRRRTSRRTTREETVPVTLPSDTSKTSLLYASRSCETVEDPVIHAAIPMDLRRLATSNVFVCDAPSRGVVAGIAKHVKETYGYA